MHYRHPRIGFAFDMPDEWNLDSARMSAEGVMVVLNLADTRLLLQVRRSQGNASTRLNLMQQHLESMRATRIAPCQAPPFGQSRDIVALSFFIAGRQQRWISVSRDGYDYTISHTDDWQDVAGAVDRLCASFIFPAHTHIAHALPVPLPDGQHNGNGGVGVHEASNWHGSPGGRPAQIPLDMDGAYAAGLPPHATIAAPAFPMRVPGTGLWQRVSERLRRARADRTQG